MKYKNFINSFRKSIGYGFNYFSFEVRLIKFITCIGLSTYDGYDIYKHLIEGNDASFHHYNFIKGDDSFDNLGWLPDVSKNHSSERENYIYHHHPYIKTEAFKKTALNKAQNLSLFVKTNDFTFLDGINNYSKQSINLIFSRVKNFNWLNGIAYYLPRGTWIKKFKLKEFRYLVKQHVHPKFSIGLLNIIETEMNDFWTEYLESRREK